MDDRYKQAILVRKDLNMPCGKLAAQVAHAAVKAVLKVDNYVYDNWNKQGSTKIVLGVSDYSELVSYFNLAVNQQLPCSLIVDEGRTIFNNNYHTTTVAIGPAKVEDIDSITGNLELL